jgi:hypothetical protein
LPEEPADLDPAGDLPDDVGADLAAQLDFSELDTTDDADVDLEGELAGTDEDTDAQLLLDLAIDPVGHAKPGWRVSASWTTLMLLT